MLRAVMEKLGYRVFEMGLNLLAIHGSDKTLDAYEDSVTAGQRNRQDDPPPGDQT
jgi:hypothetical protein